MAERRKKRKIIDGLCPICKNPTDREGTICTSCAEKRSEYQKNRREYLLSRGLCVICGKNNIFEGETTCPECRAKQYVYAHKTAERHNEYRRNRTAERKAKGLCTKCGKNKADEGYSTCSDCRNKNRKWRLGKGKKHVREEWDSEFRCVFCGKDERVPGKKLCEDCYRIRLAAIKKCNSNRKEGYNTTWKESNIKIRGRFRPYSRISG